MSSIRGTRVRIISDDGYHASARAIWVVRVVPMAESRTEKPHILLTASSNRHCLLTRMYLIQPSLMSAGFPKKKTPPSNSSRTKTSSEKNCSHGV